MIDSRDIRELVPVVQRAAAELIKRANQQGINIIITSTYRDAAYQNMLYAKGRTVAGSIVTNCRGGDSYHNWRVAFDFVSVDSRGSAIWSDSSPNWKAVGQIGMKMGLTWGGSWTGFVDKPHFEFTNGLKISDFKAGRNIPTNIALPWENVIDLTSQQEAEEEKRKAEEEKRKAEEAAKKDAEEMAKKKRASAENAIDVIVKECGFSSPDYWLNKLDTIPYFDDFVINVKYRIENKDDISKDLKSHMALQFIIGSCGFKSPEYWQKHLDNVPYFDDFFIGIERVLKYK